MAHANTAAQHAGYVTLNSIGRANPIQGIASADISCGFTSCPALPAHTTSLAYVTNSKEKT